MLNTGGKYDSKAFKKSVGLNGVGVKAVNALSTHFEVASYRDGKVRKATFERGILQTDVTEDTQDETGTYIYFEPDNTLFKEYSFPDDIVENMLRNYTYLNTGLAIMYNGRRILSRHGLEDLLKDRMTNDPLYPIIHLKGEDIEIAFTHANQYGEEYYSFVNGQHTTQGGTHQSAFKEHIAKTIKEFFGKYEYGDIRTGIEFVPLDTTKYTRFHRELAAKSVVIDANLHYVDQHRKSLQRDYKTFDEYRQRFEVPQSIIDSIMAEAEKKNIKPKDEAERQRTLPYLRLQLKALIARDLWGMNEYFYIMGETNDALQRALQII